MVLISPLSVKVSKNKSFILNLNHYRNTHYQTLNKAKIEYKEVMRDQIVTLPEYDMIELIFTLYVKTKRLCDPRNVLVIVDKFFMDALVENGKLVDDNYLYDMGARYKFGGVDKDNPRVEIEIIPVITDGLDYFTGH